MRNFFFALMLLTPALSKAQWTTNGTAVYNNSNYIGMGTAAPLTRLHVVGYNDGVAAVKVSDSGATGIEIRSSGNVPQYLDFAANSTNNAGSGTPDYGARFVYNADDFKTGLFIAMNGVGPSFAIAPNGNVSIGTLNANSYKLAVNGAIHAKQVNIDLNGWADYVFRKDYRLLTLEELSIFIGKYQHLPEIPTEKELVDSGLELGAIVKLQMKKIEELTLYLIEKDKELKKLHRRIGKLERRK